jgi:hypothetical protein
LESIANIFTSAINLETLDLPVALIFHKRFEFPELSKHLILRFNGVYPKKVGKIINEGEEVLSSPIEDVAIGPQISL